MAQTFDVISPIDGRVHVTRPHATDDELGAALERAALAQRTWAGTSLDERREAVGRMIDLLVAQSEDAALELTWQMGRPIRYSPGEIAGFAERGRSMMAAADDALAPITVSAKEGFNRYIKREPLGVVLVLAPWNYPWLTSVNSIVPALLAGNAVVLKHSGQTPLVSERMQKAADEAGLPTGVFQYLHLSHDQVARVVADPRVGHVAFTGSVEGGRAVHRAAADRFIACGLELGGKDPAYVRPDADLDFAVESLVDGAFFNSGQSCCGIERIYVHGDVYDRFVDGAVALTEKYLLGDPADPETTLGPLVRPAAADFVRHQVAAAMDAGARGLIDPAPFAAAMARGPQYLAPQILVDVDHRMDVMSEESFGPVVGIMKVTSDDEAIERMNDSRYGLTASIWTEDEDRAIAVGDRVETGTWFMNRCDYLDPELSWVGIKDSGRGCTLSSVGFEHLTRPKSYHLRKIVR
ncbi:MAG: aldehyde dehydrogenase [Deltaproteobacteria bacterium]|nr:MAG: aldehyde dehydrogenase [Deltaproteobacteria bacterium]